MPRPQKETYELTDAKQRDFMRLIQQGKNLAAIYGFVLFEDKREVELLWNGTTRDVSTRKPTRASSPLAGRKVTDAGYARTLPITGRLLQ